ncbi:PEP-CTERM sorting domain-containing protein [bacterium]|nr:MAG: PEP-CTERM sorting domain-containing protein [bacterium]
MIRSLLLVTSLAAISASASAQLASVSPFTGDLSEDFDSYSTGAYDAGLSIMGGAATVTSLDGDANYVWYSGGWFLVDKGNASSRSGEQFYGLNKRRAQGSYSTVSFADAVSSFGGYFNVAYEPSIAPSNLLSLTFFDVDGFQIGATQDVAMASDLSYTWVGFSSTQPIGSVRIEGDYFVGDDYVATNAVPEPASMAALGLGGLALLRRRRKSA